MGKYVIAALAAAILGFAGVSGAHADPWVEIGTEAWNTQISGELSFPKSIAPNASVGFRDDLHMGRHWNPNFHFVWHNSVPFLPDLRLEYGTLIGDGSTYLNGEICWNGTRYSNGQIVSQVALKLARVELYWNPVDNSVVNLRAGIDFRWVNLNTTATGSVEKSTCSSSSQLAVPEHAALPGGETNPRQAQTRAIGKSAGVVIWLPEANLGLTIHLPARFDVFFEGSGLPYAASYLYDLRLGFEHRFASGLILGVGYRRWRLHLDNTDWSVNGDLDFKGPYASLSWRF